MKAKNKNLKSKVSAVKGKIENKAKQKTKEKELIFYLIIAAFFVLMLPHIIRFSSGNTSLISGQAYYHMRTADNILEGNLGIDNMVYGSRNFIFTPYHFILAFSGYFLGMEISSKLLPFLFGMLSLILFYNILKYLRISSFNRFVVSLLLVISPSFIYLFTVSTPNCFSVFLSLLGLLLFLKGKKKYLVISIACFVIVSVSSLFNALFVMAMLIFFSVIDSRNKAGAFIAAIIMFVSYLIYSARFYYSFGFQETNLLKAIVSDLGAKTGFSIFGIILAIIGIFYLWRNKGKYYSLYLTTLFLIVATIYAGEEINLYTNFVLILFAALGLKKLKETKWTFLPVRNLVFVVIGCGLLFSTVSYMNRLPSMLPDSSIIESLEWLKQNSDAKQLVLSYNSNGYWIESVAKRPVLIDSYTSTADFDKKYSDMQNMFHNIDLDDTVKLFRKYNVSHIWIDNEMRQGLVWSKEKEGMLYLLRNNKTFKKLYSNDGSEVWEVHGIY